MPQSVPASTRAEEDGTAGATSPPLLAGSATARRIFPDDMAGKTVLHVGSGAGELCFEALGRGAARAVGLELDAEAVRRAGSTRDPLRARAEFRAVDVEEAVLEEAFDYVLCPALHHLRNPFAVLDRLIPLTRERLVVGVADARRGGPARRWIATLGAALLRGPVVLLGGREEASFAQRTVAMTPAALEGFLRDHRRVFVDVRALRSERRGEFLVAADRRSVGSLIVVAGPTSAGKSTVLDRLLSGSLPELADALGMGDPAGWTRSSSSMIPTLRDRRVERMIYHYDILRPYGRPARTHARDGGLAVLDTAQEVTFVTLVCTPDALRERLARGEIARHTRGGQYRGPDRYPRLMQDYGDPARIRRFYDEWLAFCGGRDAAHVLVSEDLRWDPVERWDEVAARHGLPPAGPGAVR